MDKNKLSRKNKHGSFIGLKSSRKGIVFTVIAIFLVLVAVSAFLLENKYSERRKSLSIESRIFSLNNFIHDVERDTERALYIASFRAFLGLTEYMAQNGTYLVNISANFQELALNGTIYGQTMVSANDSYLLLWLAKVNSEANKIGIEINMTAMSISLNQTEPWQIDVELNATLEITDLSRLAYWKKTEKIKTKVPVEGLEDPLYTVGSKGVISNVIAKTPFPFFVNQTNSNTSNLLSHATKSYYVNTTAAPSYIMRLQGQLLSSLYGIESLVNSQSLIVVGLYQNKSVVDYIYWSSSNPTHYRIQNMPNWFTLDNQSNHLKIYEVENLVLQ